MLGDSLKANKNPGSTVECRAHFGSYTTLLFRVHSTSTAAHSGDKLWKTKTGLGVVKHLQNWTNWTQGRGNSKKCQVKAPTKCVLGTDFLIPVKEALGRCSKKSG